MVKIKDYIMPFEEFLDTEMDEVDFDEMAGAWADVFGAESLVCRIFDAGSNTLIDDFLRCIHPGGPAVLPLGEAEHGYGNRSVGYFSLQMLRLLSRLRIGADSIERANSLSVLSTFDVPALLFSVADAKAYRERFFDSNMRFSSRFLGRPLGDLGGRRYSDEERQAIRDVISGTTAPQMFDTFMKALAAPKQSRPA